ncbi:hypothetical protein [Candidatus Uabimicrobium sp. HlEnr_7]|uniref:hypothetical protein n=1 Tax=Candidatus Uabimicrobium helgolandensis TaxID=3095367 RepID=UPI003557E3DB
MNKIPMIIILTLFFLFISKVFTDESQNSLPIIWESSTALQTPESSHYSFKHKAIFVSNMAGGPTDKIGKTKGYKGGWIQKIRYNKNNTFEIEAEKWVTVLNSPKGIHVSGDYLWVATVDSVIGIHIPTVEKKITIPIVGAKCLNDIAISTTGTLYISDVFSGNIYKIDNPRDIKFRKVEVFAKSPDIEVVNGLLFSNDYLIAGGMGNLYRGGNKKGNFISINTIDKKSDILIPELGMIDGIELDNDNNYIVSEFSQNVIYKIKNGHKTKLLSLPGEGTADLGFIKESNLLIVPKLMKNKITIYDYSKIVK